MHAFRVLEFDAIRERLKFHCETPLAEGMATRLEPSFDPSVIWEALTLTGEAHDALSRHTLPSLGAIRDYRSMLRIAAKGSTLGGTELFGIGEALTAMRLYRTFVRVQKVSLPNLALLGENLPELKPLEDKLLDSLDGDGSVKDSASAALGTIRQKKRSSVVRIQERIQSYVTGRTRELLSDPIYTVRDGRYVVPLKAENRGKIKGIIHDTSASGQTVFVEPADVLELGNHLRELEGQERAEEARILAALSAQAGNFSPEIIAGIEAASRLDFAHAKARLAFAMKGAMPQPFPHPRKSRIEIHGGRHPLLERESVVPLDLAVGQGSSVLITGPNTGGKTVAIKCVGLFVLMAQSGLMVPAIDVRISPFTQIWADIGDEQSLAQSLSTFSGHIKNIAEALKGLQEGAIVLLDEIGAGTDPAEGAALAIEVLRTMSDRGATILASTHYGELKAFAYENPDFENAAMEFDQKTLRPTYRVMLGAAGASQALRIAERYGIPKVIVDRAREGLGQQAQDITAMLERLEQSQRQARIAQGDADRRREELKQAEERAARKLAEADDIRKTAHAKANEVIEGALREIRLEATRLFEEVKRAPHDPKVLDAARKGLKDLQEIGHDFAEEFVPRLKKNSVAPVGLQRGSTVRLEGYSQIGSLVEDPKDGQALVQLGMLKMTVPLNRLERADQKVVSQKPKSSVLLQKAIYATTEIHLRHMRAEEAQRDLEKFIDDAVLAGLPSIRIVHGKGEGVLRKVSQDLLRKHPHVSEFRDGEPAEGGQGVTIASFK